MKKTLLFASVFVLTVLTAALLFILPASAEDVIHSGKWGDLDWILNETTGELVISGEGEMHGINFTSISAWHAYRSSIKSVKIENGVTNIGSDAFYVCKSLTSVTIPDSVKSIGFEAFCGCTSLSSITIPDSVTNISIYAFQGCTSLTSITIPNSVTNLGHGAFSGCKKLSSITIPNSVTNINIDAFRECTSLTSVTIPSSVTSIGDCAFYDCENLTSITIFNSVTSIGDCAFKSCPSLTTAQYWGTQEQWDAVEVGEQNEPLLNALQIMGEPINNDSSFDENKAPNNGNQESDSDKESNHEDAGGCGSVVSGGLGMMALIALAGGIIVSKKKR